MHGTQENFEFESNQDLYDNKLTAEVVGEALQRAKPIDAIKYIYTQKQRLQERTTPIHYVLFKYQADLSAQGQKEKALEVTTFLYKNYPAYRLGALAHAWMLDKFGRYEDGLAAIESHKDFRQRSDMWFCYCRLLQKAGRSDETIIDEYIKLLTVFEREHEKDFFGYVDALIHENKVQAADSAYRKFITGFPAHWKACRMYAWFLQTYRTEFNESIVILKQAQEGIEKENPIPTKATKRNRAMILYFLGNAYEQLTNYEIALESFKKANDEDPTYEPARAAKQQLENSLYTNLNFKNYSASQQATQFTKLAKTNPAILINKYRGENPAPKSVAVIPHESQGDEDHKKPLVLRRRNPPKEKVDPLQQKSSQKNTKKRSDKEYRQEYEILLDELNALRTRYSADDVFNQWFTGTFELKSDGSYGLFSQAENLAANGNFQRAVIKIKPVVEEIKGKIQEIELELQQLMKEKHELEEKQKNSNEKKPIINQEPFSYFSYDINKRLGYIPYSDLEEQMPCVPLEDEPESISIQKQAINKPPQQKSFPKSPKSKSPQQESFSKLPKSAPTFFSKVGKLFSDCCPGFGKNKENSRKKITNDDASIKKHKIR